MNQRWSRAGRASLELARTLFPRATLDAMARRETYRHIEPLASSRRVLDLCGSRWAAAHLHSAGAAEIVGLTTRGHRVSRLAKAERTAHNGESSPDDSLGTFDLLLCIACPLSRGRNRWLREPETIFDWVMNRLAPGGQLVVAMTTDIAEKWHDLLRQQFLRVETTRLLRSDVADLRFETGNTGSPAPANTVYEVLTASAALRHLPPGPRRLHIGSGSQRLEGWINVDIRPFPGVDLVADVTQGLVLNDIDAVFAEHFLEHLAVDHALDFLAAVQRMLTPDGRLRLSTPNLDWVWQTHYRLKAPADDKVAAGVALNRAFHGWEHKFIWNRETLELALTVIGFRDLTWQRHGESAVEHLSGLERHETYDDDDDLRHVLIVEALKGTPDPEGLGALRERLQREFLDHVAGY